MNANAIRVHGHVAGRALYEVADEMGLMIWQDVPLQWGYDDSAAFADNAVRQTRAMMDQFGNSPAIIVWGGHNEPPWNSPWMEKRFPTGVNLKPDPDAAGGRCAGGRHLPHRASLFRCRRALLGRVVFRHPARPARPGENRDYYRVWRPGAAPALHPEDHYPGPSAVAENHRCRRPRLGAMEVP